MPLSLALSLIPPSASKNIFWCLSSSTSIFPTICAVSVDPPEHFVLFLWHLKSSTTDVVVVYFCCCYCCQVSVYSSVLSHHNKDLEWRTLKPSVCHISWVLDRPCYSSQVSNIPLELLDKSVLQLCVTALFYLENSRKIHPRGMRACWPKDVKRRARRVGRERERETPQPFGSSFYMFFSPWVCPI